MSQRIQGFALEFNHAEEFHGERHRTNYTVDKPLIPPKTRCKDNTIETPARPEPKPGSPKLS